MPVYNEQRLIAEAVRRVRAQDCVSELIVVDDGSTDATRLELQKVRDLIDHLVLLPRNRGKGAALREGVRYVTGTYIVLQDSDLELDPADIERLAAPLLKGEAEIVCGSRIHRGNRKVVSKAQWLANRAVTGLATWLYRTELSDMATAARALTKDMWDRLELESDRFGIEAELHAKSARVDARILEIPIVFRPRTKLEGKKIRWTDGLVAGKTLFRYRMWRPDSSRRKVSLPPPLSTYGGVRAHGSVEPAVSTTTSRTFEPVMWEPAVVGVTPSAVSAG